MRVKYGKKSILHILAAVLLGLLLSGCGGKSPERTETGSETAESLVSFTDDTGKSFSLPRPKRVAVLIGSFADIWCTAGGKESLVAAASDSWTSFDLQLEDRVVDLGSTTKISLETLLKAEPELVIGSLNTALDLTLEESLSGMGIPTALFQVTSFEDYLRMLKVCTELCGAPERYELYGEQVRRQVEAARGRQTGEPQRVLYIRASKSSLKVKNSQGSVLGEMLASLGTVNVADSDTSLLENLSLESILLLEPDRIFLVYQGTDPAEAQSLAESQLLSHPAWNSLKAVQEGRLYVMDPSLYNLKPNARWGEAYETLAEILYGTEQ